MTAIVRVLVADDQDLLRDGLVAILDAEPDLEVTAQVSCGPDAVSATISLKPDVVLMDVQMPGGDGLTATKEILARCPKTRVIVLTMFDLDEYVAEALRAGASGFLLKTTPSSTLTAAVRTCATGEMTLAPTVTRRLVETYVRQPTPGGTLPPRLQSLTPRELDILRALARGLSNLEIGHELYLAESTVKTHVTRILAKLQLRDRLQAACLAYGTGVATGTPDDTRPV